MDEPGDVRNALNQVCYDAATRRSRTRACGVQYPQCREPGLSLASPGMPCFASSRHLQRDTPHVMLETAAETPASDLAVAAYCCSEKEQGTCAGQQRAAMSSLVAPPGVPQVSVLDEAQLKASIVALRDSRESARLLCCSRRTRTASKCRHL
jgi:hypothetical protein